MTTVWKAVVAGDTPTPPAPLLPASVPSLPMSTPISAAALIAELHSVSALPSPSPVNEFVQTPNLALNSGSPASGEDPVQARDAQTSPARNVWSTMEKAREQISKRLDGGILRSRIPEGILRDSKPFWSTCIIGHFLSDPPHIGKVHATANRLWRTKDQRFFIDAQYLTPTSVLFRIPSEHTRDWVLKKKFWYVGDSTLVVQQWTPKTASAKPDLSNFPVWVDFKNVPDDLFCHQGLRFLGDLVGNFQRIHPNTEKCIRLDVARVMVSLNLEQSLPEKILLKADEENEEITISVAFPWLPKKCHQCNRWGHEALNCTVRTDLSTNGPSLVSEKTEELFASENRGTEVSNVEPSREQLPLQSLNSLTPDHNISEAADDSSLLSPDDKADQNASVKDKATEVIDSHENNTSLGWSVVSRRSPEKVSALGLSPKSPMKTSPNKKADKADKLHSRFDVLSLINEDDDIEIGQDVTGEKKVIEKAEEGKEKENNNKPEEGEIENESTRVDKEKTEDIIINTTQSSFGETFNKIGDTNIKLPNKTIVSRRQQSTRSAKKMSNKAKINNASFGKH